MKKSALVILAILVLIIGIIGFSSDKGKNDLEFLTRVDVQLLNIDGTYDEAQMITDKETVTKLRNAFQEIQWEKNVYPDMVRREDLKATLFLQLDKNMPEQLIEYLIWFNQESQKAEIINNTEHAYGRLDVENTKILKDILNR